jgi:hypothetical protein
MSAMVATTSIAKDLRLTPQARTVLAHLGRRQSITPVEAMATYSISRLASCINEIRKVGYSVKMDLREDERGHKYGRYSMAKAN